MDAQWPCAHCTLLNAPAAPACAACAAARPAAAAPPARAGGSRGSGGAASFASGQGYPWQCRGRGCAAMNGPANAACARCGAGRDGRPPAPPPAPAPPPPPPPPPAPPAAPAHASALMHVDSGGAEPAPPRAAAAAGAPASAYDLARPFALDADGEPALDAGEVIVHRERGVDVYDGDAKRDALGVALVTSARVLWHDGGARAARRAWLLRDVRHAAGEEGGLFSSRAPKVVITVAGAGGGGRAAAVRLGFKEGAKKDARDAWLNALIAACERHAAAAAAGGGGGPAALARGGGGGAGGAAAAPAPAAPSFAVSAREEARLRDGAAAAAQAALAATAFSSLRELEANAQSVMALARASAAEVALARARRGDAEGAREDAAVAELLADLGAVGSPVTRANSGGAFLDALARQVAAWAREPLRAAGGLLPLTEVYCRFNRARGLDCVSPGDLLAALALLPRLRPPPGLAVRDVSLGGGAGARTTRVLALDELADDRVAARVRALLDARAAAAAPAAPAAGISAPELAAAWRLPLGVAAAHLRVAEAAGAVARDESVAGTRFFANAFA